MKTTCFYFLFLLSFLTIFAQENLHPFTVITIEKSGTHLIKPLIKYMTNKNFEYSPNEINYSPQEYIQNLKEYWKNDTIYLGHHPKADKEYVSTFKKNKIKVLFLIRDFRDQFISLWHWWKKYNDEAYIPVQHLQTHDQWIEILTNRMQFFNAPINQPIFFYSDRIFTRLPWIDIAIEDPNFCCLIKYENLIGPKGGGSIDSQIREVLKIAKHIGHKCTVRKAHLLAEIINNKIFGDSPTYRQGSIGDWKRLFNEDLKQIFKELLGERLIQAGYEKDNDW